MSVIETSYIDPKTGVRKTGYAKEGLTYKNPEATERVDVGSVVDTKNGAYILTNEGGVLYSDYLRSLEGSRGAEKTESAKQSALEASRARTEAAVAQLEGGRGEIDREYDDAARGNYVSHTRGVNGLANGLASSGLYNSGYSDSARVADETSYREGQYQNGRERRAALEKLEREITSAKLSGSAELAELTAKYDSLAAEQLNADREYAASQASASAERQRREAERQTDASRYADSRADAEYARKTDESRYADTRADAEYERQTDESRYADTRADMEYARQTDESRYADTRADAEYSAKLDKAALAAKYGDYGLLKELGISPEVYKAIASSAGSTAAAPAKEAEKESAPLDVAGRELATQLGKGMAANAQKQGWSVTKLLDTIDGYRATIIERYGEEFWPIYAESVLKNFPGASLYSAPEEPAVQSEQFVSSLSVKEYYNEIMKKLDSGLISGEEAAKIVNRSYLLDEQKRELLNLLGLDENVKEK